MLERATVRVAETVAEIVAAAGVLVEAEAADVVAVAVDVLAGAAAVVATAVTVAEADGTNFQRLFKKTTGKAPKKYRPPFFIYFLPKLV